jgi:glycosyltransferase involved in cell wall biosynthesis
MRILSVHKFWNNGNLRRLGASRSILFLYDEFVKKGHQVDYLFINDVLRGRPRRLHLSFPFIIVPRILALHQRWPYDVIEISGADGWVYGLYHKWQPRTRRPLLLTRTVGLEHLYWATLLADECLGHGGIPRRSKITYPLFTLKAVEWTIKSGDHFICLCEQDRNFIIRQEWLSEDHISVIPPGLPEEYLASTEKSPSRDGDLLFVGSWTPRKGTKYLVEAFSQIVAQRPDTRLTLAGAHQSDPGEIMDAFPPSLRHQVRILPALSEQKLVDQYLTHKVMLFPSLYEGFGMVVLEAMACRLPVVTTPIGGMADVIEDSVTGVFVPLRDSRALAEVSLELLADKQRRREMGAHAQERAQAFPWAKIADQHESLYQALLVRKRA